MYLRLISLKRIIQVWWDNWKKNLMGIQVYTSAQRLLKMKYIFWINFHTPIEKQSNKDWNILIHLKNNCPSIKICLICWFLVMTFNLWFYHEFWINGYAYILEIVLDSCTISKMSLDVWHWMKCTSNWHLDNLFD